MSEKQHVLPIMLSGHIHFTSKYTNVLNFPHDYISPSTPSISKLAVLTKIICVVYVLVRYLICIVNKRAPHFGF